MKKLSLALAAIMLLSLISGCSMLPQSAPVEEEVVQEEVPVYYYYTADELKAKLEASDYKAIKFAEGWLSETEYAPIKAERQALRDKINTLEKAE